MRSNGRSNGVAGAQKAVSSLRSPSRSGYPARPSSRAHSRSSRYPWPWYQRLFSLFVASSRFSSFAYRRTQRARARACVFRLTVRPTIDRRTADRVGRFTLPHRAARTDRATFTADRPIWSSSTRFEATGALSHARRSQAWSARSGVTTDGRVHIYWVSLSNYVDTPSNAGIRRNESRDRRSKFSSKRRRESNVTRKKNKAT